MMPRKDTNLASSSRVRQLLQDLGARPKRSLGQNFLVDRNILNILLDATAATGAESVLEVGPGLGIVTEELAGRCRFLTAVEKDRRLAAFLRERFAGRTNVSILEADMLDVDVERLPGGKPDTLVSNLPYSTGSRILVNLFRMDRPPSRVIVTVQSEVADRLVAGPGSRDYGVLAVWCGLVYESRKVRVVKPTCFWPRPEVSSAIVAMTSRPPPALSREGRSTLYRLTKQAFGQRRKQMATLLPRLRPGAVADRAAAVALLEEHDLAATARPQDVPVECWCELAQRLALPAGSVRGRLRDRGAA